MSDTIIRVENLGKKYLIGHHQEGVANYGTLRDAITYTAKSFVQAFQKSKSPIPSNQEEFWALKDVSFEVKQGETIGIIGRNGAGKSTLLKILSRITEPTTGTVKLGGRVASLLEVGTGFHPELTGRENIYLNGAILGMSKVEIKSKFDEIVAFAEIEKFLDTPVKRYSSGMYVRLAFAVAAHLEPEILIVDEVLAVGDLQFQKKCRAKMRDIGDTGTTILFVSHYIPLVRSLCTRVLTFKKGQVLADSDSSTAIELYLNEGNLVETAVEWDADNAPQTGEIRFIKAYILNKKGQMVSVLDYREEFSLNLEYEVKKPIEPRIGCFVQTSDGIAVCGSNDPEGWTRTIRPPGLYTSQCHFPSYILNAGNYVVRFGADIPPCLEPLVRTPFCLTFTVEDTEGHGLYKEKLPGILRPKLNWKVKLMSGRGV